jgi:hypothetical protein
MLDSPLSCVHAAKETILFSENVRLMGNIIGLDG